MSLKEILSLLLENRVIIKDNKLKKYILSPTGEALITGLAFSTTTEPKNKDQELLALAEQLRDMFPVGVISGNQYVKSPVKDVEGKLKTFFRKYDYTPEQVKLAVSGYVNQCKQVNYKYMKCLHYFIMKDQVSTLASWIDNMHEEDKSAEAQIKGEII